MYLLRIFIVSPISLSKTKIIPWQEVLLLLLLEFVGNLRCWSFQIWNVSTYKICLLVEYQENVEKSVSRWTVGDFENMFGKEMFLNITASFCSVMKYLWIYEASKTCFINFSVGCSLLLDFGSPSNVFHVHGHCYVCWY